MNYAIHMAVIIADCYRPATSVRDRLYFRSNEKCTRMLNPNGMRHRGSIEVKDPNNCHIV